MKILVPIRNEPTRDQDLSPQVVLRLSRFEDSVHPQLLMPVLTRTDEHVLVNHPVRKSLESDTVYSTMCRTGYCLCGKYPARL